ncbi:MAG: UDP-N-acetylmuramoyl-L-alanyl-D-glutamate--2,6-diaminopimelate ligase [Cellvibrionaceae bacterium]
MMAAQNNQNTSMLGHLVPELSAFKEAGLSVGRLVLDSRKIEAGDCFVALRGTQLDGTQFIDGAIKRGAKTVMVSGASFDISYLAGPVTLVTVPNLEAELSAIAGRWFDRPSSKMNVVAITGTNGKTTCCQWLAQLLGNDQAPCASIGTLGFGLLGEPLIETGLTTPDAIATQAILSELHIRGAKSVVMEASSHSLAQARAAAVDIDVAVFTNIGRDHLDYHGDVDSYVAAKLKLMGFSSLRAAAINLDDAYAKSFVDALDSSVAVITFGFDSSADLSAANVRYLAQGVEADITYGGDTWPIALPIWGEFNVSNLLAVIAAAIATGRDIDKLIEKLNSLKPVAGRLESVSQDSKPQVLVDFAHTADALESVLLAIRAHSQKKLWCVFGCGGDRDKGKRVLMAEVAEKYADHVVVTSDNPRSEDPQSILQDVLKGFQKPERVISQVDRRAAIEYAIENAAQADCVLVAGKGHEQYQLIAGEKISFSDLDVAKNAVARRMKKESVQ